MSNDSQLTDLEKVREGSVTFSFKKAEPIHLELDLNAITWEDNLKFANVQERMDKGELTEVQGMGELNQLLSRLVGRDVSKLPSVVVTQLLVQFKKMSEVRDEEAKNSD